MAERERIQTELDNLRDVAVADRRRLTANITVSDAELMSDMNLFYTLSGSGILHL